MNINILKSRKSGGNARGYTLVEVMISVALLAVMLGAFFPTFAVGFASINTTREDERATQIVTQKLEGFRLITWLNQNICPGTFVDCYNPAGKANGTGGTVYYGTITINTSGSAQLAAVIPTSCSYQSEIRLVTIGVTWTNYINGSPIAHSRQMQTLSAYYGLQNYLYGDTGAGSGS